MPSSLAELKQLTGKFFSLILKIIDYFTKGKLLVI